MMRGLFLIALVLVATIGYAQTGHFDASDTDNIFTTAGEPPSGAPADGNDVQQWEDESLTLWWSGTAAPNYRTTSGLLLPALDFNGSTDLLELRTTGSAARTLDQFFAVGAKSILIVLRLDENCDGADDNEPWLNDTIINDGTQQLWGIHCWIDTGQNKLQLYNWDGNGDIVTLNVSINTNYVVGFRHDGTNLHGSLNCGSETTALSGNTTALTGAMVIGAAINNSLHWSGRIGEIKTWDTSNAGGNFATECAALHSKWVVAAGTVPSVFLNLNGAQ